MLWVLALAGSSAAQELRAVGPTQGLELLREVCEAQDDAAHVERLVEACVRWRTQLAAEAAGIDSRHDRAAFALRFLHAEVLRGSFRADASRIAETLDQGDYNCLSSAVLYAVLADSLGLECVAIAWPTHVALAVSLPSGLQEVQTTCDSWFDLPSERQDELRAEMLRLAGLTADASPLQLGSRGLLALAHFNRGVALIQERRFEEAAAANRRALELEPRWHPASANLATAWNNRAVALQRQGDDRAALELLRAAADQLPGDPTVLRNLDELQAAVGQ